MNAATDHELFAATAAGDAEAFGELYSRYAEAVGCWFRRKLGTRPDIEDLVQDTFTEALARIQAGTDHPRDEVKGWLLGSVTHYVLRCYFRQGWRYKQAAAQAEDTARRQMTEQPAETTATTGVQVAEQLAALTPKRRLAIQLHYLDGVPTDHAAELVGSSQHNCKDLRYRGLKDLRARMAGHARTAVTA